METQKKKWQTPQLIILARGTPEESVLLACKSIQALRPVMAGNYAQSNCGNNDPNCSACQSRGGGAS